MVGDGVNDVLSLKKAQLGIAMQSGSQATRNVADMVLLGDSFATLLPAFTKGQAIVSGMSNAMCLFLTRVVTSTLVIIAITMLGLAFPFEPAQLALTVFTVGIPTFFLALWARPQPQAPNLLHALMRFVLPVAIVTMVIGVAIYTFHYQRVLDGVNTFHIHPHAVEQFERATGLRYNVDDKFGIAAATIVAQTVLSIFISYAAFLLIVFLEPPITFFTGWTTLRSDKRPAWLSLGLALIFLFVIETPALSGYFGMISAAPPIYLTLAIALPVWTLILRTLWRQRWFERFLMIEQ
jgi:cation-transporting ATPase E